MHKNRPLKLVYFVLILLFSLNWSYSQSADFNKIIREVEEGETEKAQLLLNSLEKDKTNLPDVKYLKAILTQDGELAAKIYKEVVYSAEDSEWKDDALFKLYQYYYSRGEFNESDKYARMLQESFPESEYVERISKRTLKKQTKDLAESEELTNVILSKDEQKKTLPKNNLKFFVQVGVFSSKLNAEKFATQFKDYKIHIVNKSIQGKTMFAVWLGEFENEEECRKAINYINNKYKVNGFIVPLNN